MCNCAVFANLISTGDAGTESYTRTCRPECLADEGGRVWLSSGSGGTVTGYQEGVQCISQAGNPIMAIASAKDCQERCSVLPDVRAMPLSPSLTLSRSRSPFLALVNPSLPSLTLLVRPFLLAPSRFSTTTPQAYIFSFAAIVGYCKCCTSDLAANSAQSIYVSVHKTRASNATSTPS